MNAGAVPVFADVDRNSGNMNANSVAKVVTSKTRAVIPVHLAGWPCDMDPIMLLAEKYGLKVIEIVRKLTEQCTKDDRLDQLAILELGLFARTK